MRISRIALLQTLCARWRSGFSVERRSARSSRRAAVVALLALLTGGPVVADSSQVSPSVLPEALRQKWNELRPSFNENSRCAAVWDGAGDADKQALKCSIYMRMGSEAERRAMSACEEFRAEQKIRSPCRLVKP